MKKLFYLLILSSILIAFLPLPARADFHFVPCGRADQQNDPGNAQCNFCHLIIMLVRLINYLIALAAFVAMYYILLCAWNLATSVGNAEKIEKAKKGISNAVVGFGLVVLAFITVNLLINGLFGKPDVTRRWWDVNCIFDITNTNTQGCALSCPLGGGGNTK